MSVKQSLIKLGVAAVVVCGITGCYQAEEDKSPVNYGVLENPALMSGSILSPSSEGNYSGNFLGQERKKTAGSSFFSNGNNDTQEEETDTSPTYGKNTVYRITPNFNAQIVKKQKKNSDSIGWLYIPGTNINDIILKNPKQYDNNYYLNVNFNGKADRNGTYCVDRRAKFGTGTREELSRNTTIYGHSWDDNPNGGLFSQLKKYRSASFARSHPYIFFSTENEDMAWEVFAVFDTSVDLFYNIPDLPGDYFDEVMKVVDKASIYNYNINIKPDDKILTLSTCTYSVAGHKQLPAYNDYRFVIMARLVGPEETAKTKAVFTTNRKPVSPDAIINMLDTGIIQKYAGNASM